ncbi:hypothetical protein LguiA_013744 [Lonicera macranthoides]
MYPSTLSFLMRKGPCLVLDSSVCTASNSDTITSLKETLLTLFVATIVLNSWIALLVTGALQIQAKSIYSKLGRAGLASYPIDTVRRRMMMTSGEAVKYKSSLDAFSQIVKKKGAKSLFKGAGANILRAVAGAGVLAGYDKLQLVLLGKKYGSGGGSILLKRPKTLKPK